MILQALLVIVIAFNNLQQQHFTSSPASTFSFLSEEAKKLNISSFDIYGDFHVTDEKTSSFLRSFESEVASELGKEDAVFMPSGVMAQSIALLIHSQNNEGNSNAKKKFICHESSHLLLHEQESFKYLLHMTPIVIQSKAFHGFQKTPMTFLDIKEQVISSTPSQEEENANDISTLLLELPHRELGGKCTPFHDIQKMRQYCKENKVQFHCDGARIFEATTFYEKSVSEICEPFDSVYISFYKGLGGLSGAMLLGSRDFCSEARTWLRRFGGNLYTLLPYAISGWSGYRKHWLLLGCDSDSTSGLSFIQKKLKLKRIIESLSKHEEISKIVSFDPTIPQVNMIHGYLSFTKEDCEKAVQAVEQKYGICVLSRIREIDNGESAYDEGYKCKFEWAIGEANGSIDDSIFVNGWKELASTLLASENDLKG